ncbi:MAG: SRPBCC domain-containing protein [Alphaproteobacteria bacterium]|nr:SRPBCC domain-containing protein [Alphaproteobacteria bacterium]
MASVRQQINIAASPRVVWRQLTTKEGLCSWWADDATLQAHQGGRIVLANEGDDEGQKVEERGVFLEHRPTRKLEIKWDTSSPAPTAGSRVRFQLARDGEETRVSVVHTGAFLDDEEVFARYDKEWRSALKALRGSLEGEGA